MWSRMWVEYCLRKWWHNYSICVLERKTKSCVSVYAKRPGVNIICLQYIRSRHNLDTRFKFISGLLVCSSVCHICQSVHLSGSLFISPVARLLYVHDALSLYHRSSFLLDVVTTMNCVDIPGRLFHGNIASIDWLKLTR